MVLWNQLCIGKKLENFEKKKWCTHTREWVAWTQRQAGAGVRARARAQARRAVRTHTHRWRRRTRSWRPRPRAAACSAAATRRPPRTICAHATLSSVGSAQHKHRPNVPQLETGPQERGKLYVHTIIVGGVVLKRVCQIKVSNQNYTAKWIWATWQISKFDFKYYVVANYVVGTNVCSVLQVQK